MKNRIFAVNTHRYPPYASIDKHSGRCRIGKKTLDLAAPRGAVTGGVIKLRLCLPWCPPVTVLCTLWPDTKHCLDDATICIDVLSLVHSAGDGSSHEKLVDWTEAECEVL
ncbi:hypothetical protein EON65_53905 [archaeon]|nr:MAG: hypothetical protein EON65_53905 [archaeon]